MQRSQRVHRSLAQFVFLFSQISDLDLNALFEQLSEDEIGGSDSDSESDEDSSEDEDLEESRKEGKYWKPDPDDPDDYEALRWYPSGQYLLIC